MNPTTAYDRIAERTLRPISGASKVLFADTRVWVLNRGGGEIRDMYDGQDWSIPDDGAPWAIPYAVAMHLKARAIAPGTRNPETHKVASRLAILRPVEWDQQIDAPDRCQPFTPEELDRMAHAVEGLDRSQLSSAEARRVQVIPTARAMAAVYAKGGSDEQPLDERLAIAAPVPREQNEALAEMQADDAAARSEGHRAGGGRRR